MYCFCKGMAVLAGPNLTSYTLSHPSENAPEIPVQLVFSRPSIQLAGFTDQLPWTPNKLDQHLVAFDFRALVTEWLLIPRS